jgi:hypothetical protein
MVSTNEAEYTKNTERRMVSESTRWPRGELQFSGSRQVVTPEHRQHAYFFRKRRTLTSS